MKHRQASKSFFDKSQLIYQSTYLSFIDETDDNKQKRIARFKTDVESFVDYYLPHYATAKSADFHLKLAKQVKTDKTCKILIRWGRGLAKSVWADVVIPLWLWTQNDIKYMVIVGNNLDKAKILLSDLQAEFTQNQRLINDFGLQHLHGSWEDGYFRTKNGFVAKALGMGQSPRGLRLQNQRPDYIVCDDLEDKETTRNPARQNTIVQWIEQDLLPTMDGDTRRYLHPNNNFAPRSIQQELHLKHTNWTLNQVDAYNPTNYQPAWGEKYNAQYYIEIENEIGLLAASAEYNNIPHIEGKIFTLEQIQYTKLPRLDHFRIICGFWDIAYAGNKNSDYNAVRVWGLYKNEFYYIDSFVAQTEMNKAVLWIIDFQKSLPDNVVIHWRYEAQFWNKEVERTISDAEILHNCRLNISKTETPRTKKYDRILSLQPIYQNSRIYYNEAKKNHNYTIIGLQQLLAIEPNYKTHDDAPDADQQAISFLTKYITNNQTKLTTGNFTKNAARKFC